MSYDSELETMRSAARCRKNKSDGFQGCRNKEICGSHGFYLAMYSREGLCSTCEKKLFPDRFHGCLFCRGQQPSYCTTCPTCYGGFTNYIGQHFNLSGQAAHRLCDIDIKPPSIPYDDFAKLPFVEYEEYAYEWPGFYMGQDQQGNHTWSKPDLSQGSRISIPGATWGNCHEKLEEYLKAHGIVLRS